MRGFLDCLVYLALIGAACFLVGRLIPQQWYHAEQFPYKAYAFEKTAGSMKS